MPLEIRRVASRRDLDRFVELPWRLYRGDPCWVPPLIGETKRAVNGAAPSGLPRELFLAERDGNIAGRLYVAFEPRALERPGPASGFFSLFECEDDQPAAGALFGAACEWLARQGIGIVKGPVCTSGFQGDENKGLLVEGFDRPPVVMTSYNPPYYARLIEGAGFEKDLDLFAYYLDKNALFQRDPERVIRYAQRRYQFTLETVELARLDEYVAAFTQVLEAAIPAEWPDMVVPTLGEVREMAERMRPIADTDLIVMARSGGEPIGFGLALPDYNQVLIKLNGRMTPLAVLKYLWHKRHIDAARIFVLFVVPAFRRKGVSHAIYHQIFVNGTKKGYVWGEGSTIGETNAEMRADIESIGGRHYKTYRIYRKHIRQLLTAG